MEQVELICRGVPDPLWSDLEATSTYVSMAQGTVTQTVFAYVLFMNPC